MRFIRILSALFYLLCFCGCFYQLYHISNNYFRYKIRTETSFKAPREIELPAIDFAIPIPSVLNFTAFRAKYPSRLNDICNQITVGGKKNVKICENLFKKSRLVGPAIESIITVEDITKLSIDTAKDALNYVVSGPKENLVENHCKIDRYFNSLTVFMRFSCLNNSIPIKVKANDLINTDSIFASIGLNVNLTFFGIRLSHPNIGIDSRFDRYKLINLKPSMITLMRIEFTKYTTNLLPSPYESHCVDYNRQVTMEQCLNDAMLNAPNASLFHATVQPFGLHPGHLKFSFDESSLPRKVYLDCLSRSRYNECSSIDYKTFIDMSSEYSDLQYLAISLQPDTPNAIMTEHPKQTFSEYVIFVGSVLSTWFGISVINQLILTLRFIEKIIHYPD